MLKFNQFTKLKVLILISVHFIAFFVSFYGIHKNSFTLGDEALHARVVQDIAENDNWLEPKVNNEIYRSKPPFKMWITAIYVKLLGQSTFSYRVYDGLISYLFLILMFYIARFYYQSNLVSLSVFLSLIGSRALFQEHGLREGTQDPMLLYLLTVAILTSYNYISIYSDITIRSKKGLIVGGLLGLAFLVKSVAVVPAYIVIFAIPYLNTFKFSSYKKYLRFYFEILIVSFLVAAPYLFYRQYLDPHFFKIFFGHEVARRAVTGFHNTHLPFYYLEAIFDDNKFINPILVILSILVLSFRLRVSILSRFLLFWAFSPIILYSLAKSHLEWYIFISLPALSLMIGFSLKFLSDINYSNYLKFRYLSAVIRPLIFLLFAVCISINLWRTWPDIKKIKENKFDSLAQIPELNRYKLFLSKNADFTVGEDLYIDFFVNERINSVADIEMSISKGLEVISILTPDDLSQLVSQHKPSHYSIFQPVPFRTGWLYFVAFNLPENNNLLKIDSLKIRSSNNLNSDIKLNAGAEILSAEILSTEILSTKVLNADDFKKTFKVTSEEIEFGILGDKIKETYGVVLRIESDTQLSNFRMNSEELTYSELREEGVDAHIYEVFISGENLRYGMHKFSIFLKELDGANPLKHKDSKLKISMRLN